MERQREKEEEEENINQPPPNYEDVVYIKIYKNLI